MKKKQASVQQQMVSDSSREAPLNLKGVSVRGNYCEMSV